MMIYLLAIGSPTHPVARLQLERLGAPDHHLRRPHLHQWQRPALHPPIQPGLLRLPQQARQLRRLLRQLHHRDPRPRSLLPLPRQALLARLLGHQRVGFHRRLHRLGRPQRRRQRLRPHRRLGRSERHRRLAPLPPRSLPPRPARPQSQLRRQGLGPLRLLRRLPPASQLLRPRRPRHRPRHLARHGRKPPHQLRLGNLRPQSRSPPSHAPRRLPHHLATVPT